jgi:hypothetical protein
LYLPFFSIKSKNEGFVWLPLKSNLVYLYSAIPFLAILCKNAEYFNNISTIFFCGAFFLTIPIIFYVWVASIVQNYKFVTSYDLLRKQQKRSDDENPSNLTWTVVYLPGKGGGALKPWTVLYYKNDTQGVIFDILY